jgi:uncharacterized protein (DUF736 family)
MKIGTFLQDQEGNIHGKIYGLGLSPVSVLFDPQTSKDRKPYYKLIADPVGSAYEIGAAFEKTKDGMIYHSVSLDSPVFAAPINVALFPDKDRDGIFNLIFDRAQQMPKMDASANVGQPVRRPTVTAATP